MLQTILSPQLDQLAEDFLEHYRFSFSELSEEVYQAFHHRIRSVLTASIQVDREALVAHSKRLSALNFEHHIPFIVLINELNVIKNRLTQQLIEHNAKEAVFQLQGIYADVENILAHEHLVHYMDRLEASNTARINSLKDLMKQNLVHYYKGHLEWLTTLTQAIRAFDVGAVPELNASRCLFGGWLYEQGAEVISNRSKYQYLLGVHQTLHSLAKAIQTQMNKPQPNFNIMASYLEKCELISLSIGTELALIDNRLMVKESSKDNMTGALSRNTLDAIFNHQYELSLATDATFVLVMCDLDHFKKLNDAHGHLAGDAVLTEFVSIVRNTLRESDIVIRYGGEEFVVLMPNSRIEQAYQKLENVRLNMNTLCCSHEDQWIATSVSMGVVEIVPRPIDDPKQLVSYFIKQADKLLYQAKSAGRNRVEIESH